MEIITLLLVSLVIYRVYRFEQVLSNIRSENIILESYIDTLHPIFSRDEIKRERLEFHQATMDTSSLTEKEKMSFGKKRAITDLKVTTNLMVVSGKDRDDAMSYFRDTKLEVEKE